MKIFINLTEYILILLVFYGCNGDVFVDDFRSADSELTLDGNGDTKIIRFASSNWDVLGVYTYDEGFTYSYAVYDAGGDLITTDQFPNPRELKIAVEENARSTHFQFKLTVSNEYESQEIYVDISPSDRYVIDHITYYSLDEDSYEKRIEAKRSFVQPNGWGIDYPCLLSPYENVYHEVMFRSDMPELFQLLGESNLTVEIPSVENGHLQMNGKQVRYTSKQQTLPFSNTEQIEVSIPPYTTQRITVLIEYYWFETRYALYAVHPKTGKRRTINGTLQSKMPAAYYITRENIK